MTLQSTTMTGARLPGTASDTPPRPVRVTRSLLGYGVIAGPTYLVVSLAQALTRDGFDPTRHAWSLLANGELGWIQITNLTVTGAMLVAFAVGLHRALAGGAAGGGRRGCSGPSGSAWRCRRWCSAPAPPRASRRARHPSPSAPGTARCTTRSRASPSAAWSWPAWCSPAGLPPRGGVAGRGPPGWPGWCCWSASPGCRPRRAPSWSVVGLIVALVVVFAWTSAVALHWYRRAGAETNRCDGSATSPR